MKKTYKLVDLDCADCAAKMETAINKIDGVEKAVISFMTQRLSVTADESKMEEIMKKAAKVCNDINPDTRIIL